MVAVKGRRPGTTSNIGVSVNLDHNSRTSHGTVGTRNFKVFSGKDNIGSHAPDLLLPNSERKPAVLKDKIGQLNASDPKIKGPPNKLEKNSEKCFDSVKIKVERRVLGDISNFQGNFSRNKISDGSKLGKCKIGRLACSQRTSVGPGARIGSSSSSKPLKGKMMETLGQRIGSCHTQGRAPTKESKVCNDDLRTRAENRKKARDFGRQSLPVFKKTDKVDRSYSKKVDTENKENSKERQGFPVKPKISLKAVPQVSNVRSYLRRNRASDGFIIMGDQSKGVSQTSSRRVMKATLRTTVTNPKAQRASNYKPPGLSKLTFRGSISSKKEEPLEVSKVSEHTASDELSEQLAEEEIPSNSKSGLESTTLHIIPKGKSDRRKSYTSLLVSRSKLLKEHGKVMKQELLPSIYDECNHLEVAEYVDEIYQYYWVMEAQNQSMKNYMKNQTDITSQMRGILINWLIEFPCYRYIQTKFDLMQETLYLMVTLLDNYLSLVCIKKNEMQLVGLTSLLLASKYEDFWHPKVMELISISAELYSRDQMLGMEKTILKNLKFRLNVPTPYVFMLRFLRAAQSDQKFENLAFYLTELCLVEYEALNFKPSLLCASAIYVARCTLQMTPAWTPLLSKHARYEEHEIRVCAEMILRFHRAARKGMLKVTYEKYMSAVNGKVAAIKPLDRLP